MAELLVGIWPFARTAEIQALLARAAARSGEAIEDGPGWTTWTVHRGAELIGAAQVRRTTDRACEVVLLAGSECREWLGPLAERMACWARDEGCTAMRARGRSGWARLCGRHGWRVDAADDDLLYRRELH